MKKFVVISMMLLILVVALTGCMREPGVCNYDGTCTEDETDECADCKNTLGRDVKVPSDTTTQSDSP